MHRDYAKHGGEAGSRNRQGGQEEAEVRTRVPGPGVAEAVESDAEPADSARFQQQPSPNSPKRTATPTTGWRGDAVVRTRQHVHAVCSTRARRCMHSQTRCGWREHCEEENAFDTHVHEFENGIGVMVVFRALHAAKRRAEPVRSDELLIADPPLIPCLSTALCPRPNVVFSTRTARRVDADTHDNGPLKMDGCR